MPTRARDQRSKALVTHFLSCHLQSSRQDTSLCLPSTSAVENGIADGTIALASYGSMWISIRAMKTQLAQKVFKRAHYNI